MSASAKLDARILVGHALGLDDVQLVCNEKAQILSTQVLEIEALAMRRLAGEPVARILGHKEFYSLNFMLNGATLVPRPETEMLVDRAIAVLEEVDAPRVLELGVGSGCIVISILHQLQKAQGLGVDFSELALVVAKENAKTHDVEGRIGWGLGSWFGAVPEGEKYDLIVSNPPYVVSEVIEELATDVKQFDPALALDGGVDGLGAYREIIAHAPRYLNGDGMLLVEIGYDQGEAVSELFDVAGFERIEVRADLAGHSRMVEGRID